MANNLPFSCFNASLSLSPQCECVCVYVCASVANLLFAVFVHSPDELDIFIHLGTARHGSTGELYLSSLVAVVVVCVAAR